MRPVIDDPRFSAAPTLGKFAVAGRWEEAVTFRPSQSPSEAQVRAHLGESQEVACEAFFGSAFFGVRTYGPDVAPFVTTFADAMGAAPDGPAFFASMAEIGVDLGTGFAFAELGAEGAWASVGPLRITDPCTVDVSDLWAQILVSPVGRDTTHGKALEFTFTGGFTHWFALPVSDGAIMSRDKVVEALRAYCT
jgi:hypothetical protein